MARPNVGAVLDDFNRANGAVGTNWTTEPFNDAPSGFNVSGNICMGVNHSDAWWNAASFANTAGIAVGITLAGTLPAKQTAGGFDGWYLGLIQQPSTSANTADGYQIGLRRRSGGTGKDTITIWRYLNASPTVILAETDLASDLVIGDTFDLEIKTDGTINVYRNGTVIATVTDTTYFHAGESAFAEVSISNQGTANVTGFDDFYAGQVSAGTTPVSKTVTPSYNIKVQVLKAATAASYTVKVPITKTLSASYTVKVPITKNLSPSYNVITRVSKTLSASYSIASVPTNTVLPVITGSPLTGQTLTVSNGTWTNSPTSYAIQWQVETAIGSGVYQDIPGETASTLAL